MKAIAAAITLVVIAACRSGSPQPPSAAPTLRLLDLSPGDGPAVAVVGLPAEDVSRLRAARLSADDWSSLLRVVVEAGAGSADLPPVAGAYEVTADTIRFTPAFPLDRRVAYRIVFTPARLPGRSPSSIDAWRSRPVEMTVPRVDRHDAPVTRVLRTFPNDVLLENQLRIYLQFSAPMGLRRANDFVRLLDAQGQVVQGAFLPLDVSFWDAGHTRYTLLFDPGRVKRGVRPNIEDGRPMIAGRRYTLEVSADWRDAQDQRLVESFRQEFDVAPAVFEAIDPRQWRLRPPTAGTRQPLTVTFDRPLDHAIAQKALSVVASGGNTIVGVVALDDRSVQWTFTPASPWVAGPYQLAAASMLEDLAGNRIGRAFDFDPRTGPAPPEADTRLPFTIGSS